MLADLYRTHLVRLSLAAHERDANFPSKAFVALKFKVDILSSSSIVWLRTSDHKAFFGFNDLDSTA